MEPITIPKAFVTKMTEHARALAPAEACGILAGTDNSVERIYKMTNTEGSPVSFLMDSMEQFRVMKEMRLKGLRMVAIYHSHPAGGAYPSMKDISLSVYPGTAQVILGLGVKPEIKAYLIEEGEVEEIEVRVS